MLDVNTTTGDDSVLHKIHMLSN